ncbi:MAG: CamS family sex pheromone protein [Atopostipes sp.]|nr:CamS family sex pheromone protein [Atopostipes sp.]
MKKRKIVSFLALPLLLLGACQPEEENEEEAIEEVNTEDESTAVSRNQLGRNYYRPALNEDGNYIVSENRGITLSLNSGINIDLFEKDLIRLSQDSYPTDQFYLREGQYLSEEKVRTWIQRESEENPEGLNPKEAGDEEDRNPRYLNSILELDFYKEEEEGLNISGLSIGLALNSVDYYTAEQFGPTLEEEIGEEKLLEAGKEMGNEIVRRMREMDELKELPIMVSLYKQSPRDDLAGGVYLAKGESQAQSTVVDAWQNLNEERKMFPLAGESSAEGNAFANFQSEVESFFPNIGGITGRAHYVDDQLASFHIDIMTQFYGETEMISYTQFLKQSAATYLPTDIPIEILVESSEGPEAFLEKEPADTEFYSHVFD